MGSCRASRGEVVGWQSVVLENDVIRVVVLPGKGAEIHQITDLRSGTDVLFAGPWGLRPPGAAHLPGSGDDEFMWNYAGGWQVLFPSVNEACVYGGATDPVPRRGRIASLGPRDPGGRGRYGRSALLDDIPPDAVPARTDAHPALGRAGARDRRDRGERVDRVRALRLGPALRRRAAVSRAGLPVGDTCPNDRHLTRALGGRHRAARARPPDAVAARAAEGRRDRRPPRRARARRRGATTISTSRISTRGGSPSRTRGSS